jgi:hypothetical protein
MNRPRQNQLEIHAAYSPAGHKMHAVVFRDLYFGTRQLDKFYTKREAVVYAEQQAVKRRTSFVRDRRRRPRLADRKKFTAWQKRQQRVAQRQRRARLNAEGAQP